MRDLLKLTRLAPLLAGVILLVACPSAVPESSSEASIIQIPGIPHVLQAPDFCGEACVEMYARKLGCKILQSDVFNASGVDPIEARGCYTPDMKRAMEALGFRPGVVWHHVPAGDDAAIRECWGSVLVDLKKNLPTIICMRTGNGPTATEHMRLVVGYDRGKKEVIYHEPAEEDGAYKRMALNELLDLWPLKYREEQWTLVLLRLEAGEIKEPKAAVGFTAADYVFHIMELKKKLPSKDFTMVLQKPFVVIGDESARKVKSRALKTVKWAVDGLKARYFKQDPRRIIDIWLFKDKKSYKEHTWSVFRDQPTTPFGYYSEAEAALVMNIATGGGTLVHEIVHPFMEANFPGCPAWFNEGMGSLYEQSGRGTDGKIVGLTNWRLDGLQYAIKQGVVPSFKKLISTTEREFYNEDEGTNYSQARYLCYYLQQKGLLEKYYRDFKAAAGDDPSGYKTLKKILVVKDMKKFQKKWQKFVLGLEF